MLSLTSEEAEISSRPVNTLQILFSSYSYKNWAEGPLVRMLFGAMCLPKTKYWSTSQRLNSLEQARGPQEHLFKSLTGGGLGAMVHQRFLVPTVRAISYDSHMFIGQWWTVQSLIGCGTHRNTSWVLVFPVYGHRRYGYLTDRSMTKEPLWMNHWFYCFSCLEANFVCVFIYVCMYICIYACINNNNNGGRLLVSHIPAGDNQG